MRLASLVSLLCLANAASAVTLQMLSVEEMTAKSTSIVEARILNSYGALHGSLIYTHYRIQVLDSWKGSSKISEIMLPGGVANGYRQTFAGVPTLNSGDAYVMFLWAGPAGAPQLVGLTQGLLSVSADSSGAAIVSRPMTTEQLLDSNGKAVQDRPVRMQLMQLKRTVALTLSGGRPAK